MKAIETIYNGYKFRSRLEARWAVFFDKINIRYEYEAEGYVLDNGCCYLPDFYLQDIGVYVEIKPSFDTIGVNDILKINSFASEDGNNLLLIVGSPTYQSMFLINKRNLLQYDHIKEAYGELTDNIGEAFQFALGDSVDEVDFATSAFDGRWILCLKYLRNDYHECYYRDALLCAKQSRFEFKDNT